MKAFPKAMIYIGMGFTLLLLIAQAAYCFVRALYIPGAILATFTLVFALYLFAMRSRIPFAIQMITTCVGLVQKFPGTQVTAAVSLLVQVLQLLWDIR